MSRESFLLGSINEYFDFFDFRQVECERIDYGVDRREFVKHIIWMVRGDGTREIDEGGSVGRNENVLNLGVIRHRRKHAIAEGPFLEFLQNLPRTISDFSGFEYHIVNAAQEDLAFRRWKE